MARAVVRTLSEALTNTLHDATLHMSRSSTDGLAAIAFSRTCPIGVDVQRAPSAVESELLEATLDSREQQWLAAQPRPEFAFAQLWTAKEAVLKAFGVGLAWPPNRLHVMPITDSWRLIDAGPLGRSWVSHIELGHAPQIALAVALNAGQQPGV
jgi:phosphopantetheinyl transferase